MRNPLGNQLKRTQKIWEYGLGHATLAVFCAHSVSISIGICQGYSAILLPQISNEYDLDSEQMSWIASLGVVTNPIGSILSGLLADWFGRKISIQLSTLPFLMGWLCIAFGNNIYYLYAGRLITGIAAGMSAACYTYVSEISEPTHRGLFQALGPVSASFGILFTYIMGTLIHWQKQAMISCIFAAFSIFSVHFVPESPAYLISKSKYTEAFNSLLWFRRSNSQAQLEYEALKQQKDDYDGSIDTLNKPKNSCFSNFWKASTLKPFAILVTLFFLQEMSGIYAILFYAVNFFEEANLELNENISSIIVGAIRFGMSIIAVFLINSYPRKALCMISAAGMALSFGAVLIAEHIPAASILQLVCIILNVLFSMTGMLPIPWILVGELFPLSVRSIMSGVVICIAQCFIFVSVKIYPDLINYLSFTGTVGLFGIGSVAALVFSKLFLPETKNRSLEEIENYFNGSNNKLRNSAPDMEANQEHNTSHSRYYNNYDANIDSKCYVCDGPTKYTHQNVFDNQAFIDNETISNIFTIQLTGDKNDSESSTVIYRTGL